jgi:hypothetical protein
VEIRNAHRILVGKHAEITSEIEAKMEGNIKMDGESDRFSMAPCSDRLWFHLVDDRRLTKLSPGLKWPKCEVDHSPSTNAEVKNPWSFTTVIPVRLYNVMLRKEKT